jgi:hypothetical protein
MLRRLDAHLSRREAIIAAAMADVAGDLQLLDPADLIAFIRSGQFANLDSLVTSSIELVTKPGTLRFGHGGSIKVGWRAPPEVTLDMEFRHRGVEAYFRLTLTTGVPRVVLDYIRFATTGRSPAENNGNLVEALRSARTNS